MTNNDSVREFARVKLQEVIQGASPLSLSVYPHSRDVLELKVCPHGLLQMEEVIYTDGVGMRGLHHIYYRQ